MNQIQWLYSVRRTDKDNKRRRRNHGKITAQPASCKCLLNNSMEFVASIDVVESAAFAQSVRSVCLKHDPVSI